MTASIDSNLQELGRQRPEWEPWLAVIQEVLSETANAQWDGFVPAGIEGRESKIPLLAGATKREEWKSKGFICNYAMNEPFHA